MGLVFSCTKENNAIEPDSCKQGIIADSSKIYGGWEAINYRYSIGTKESQYMPIKDMIIYTFNNDNTFTLLENEEITKGTFSLEKKDGAMILNMSNGKSFMVGFNSEYEITFTPFPIVCIEGCWITLQRDWIICKRGIFRK